MPESETEHDQGETEKPLTTKEINDLVRGPDASLAEKADALGLGDYPPAADGAKREDVEQIEIGGGRRLFGSLPHFDDIESHMSEMPDDLDYFESKLGMPPDSLNNFQKQAILNHRLKFGESITKLVDNILDNYPPLEDTEGKSITIYGLSGSGKSLAAEAIRESNPNAVVMDSDTCRMNLFGQIVRDVELANSADMNELRNDLIHNPVMSGMLYLVLEGVPRELKKRGYTTILSSTAPDRNADEAYYIEHPDPSVDPRNMDIPEDLATSDDETYGDFLRAAASLEQVTNERCPDEPDTFDWENAKQQTNFGKMEDVTVKVPPFVHRIFLQNIKSFVNEGDTTVISNPKNPDKEDAKRNIVEQLGL